MYLVFIFSILKVGFEFKNWKLLFSIFIFYEYEYNGIFVNIVKTQSYFFWVMWVCKWEKLLFKKRKKKKTKPGYDVFYTQIMYSKQFTKHCQMWKEVLFSIFKWKMDTPLFETKQALDLFVLHWMVFRPNDISSPINKGWSVRLWIHSFMEAWLMFIFKKYIYRERERDFIRIIKKEVEQRVEKIEQGNHLLTLNSINLTWETT